MAPIIEVKNLKKTYAKVKAVDGITFDIAEGSCFGLLGPNGAGKSTTIEMMEGIVPPTSGEILYRGAPVGNDFRQRVGIQFQSTALQDFLTVDEVLKLFGGFYQNVGNVERLVERCALGEFRYRNASKLSGGQKQRLLLALALINEPDIVFLDEPTTGLDPQARRNFWDLVRSIKAEKKTVVLTTHYMEEAYLLCDEIAIMDHGHILVQGGPKSLLQKYFQGVAIDLPAGADIPAEWKSGGFPFGTLTVIDGKTEIQTTQVSAALDHLIKSGVELTGLQIRTPTLEDLFLELTGRGLRA